MSKPTDIITYCDNVSAMLAEMAEKHPEFLCGGKVCNAKSDAFPRDHSKRIDGRTLVIWRDNALATTLDDEGNEIPGVFDDMIYLQTIGTVAEILGYWTDTTYDSEGNEVALSEFIPPDPDKRALYDTAWDTTPYDVIIDGEPVTITPSELFCEILK